MDLLATKCCLYIDKKKFMADSFGVFSIIDYLFAHIQGITGL